MARTVVVITDHDQFREMDYDDVCAGPRWNVVDTKHRPEGRTFRRSRWAVGRVRIIDAWPASSSVTNWSSIQGGMALFDVHYGATTARLRHLVFML
jgi:hypothetical protein